MFEMMICENWERCKDIRCPFDHNIPHQKLDKCAHPCPVRRPLDKTQGSRCIPYVEPEKGPTNLASNSEIETPNQAQNNLGKGPTEQVSRTDIFLAEYEKEQASNLSKQPLLTDVKELFSNPISELLLSSEEINHILTSYLDLPGNKVYALVEAQLAKAAKLIFAELDKGCKHSFITRNCPECYQELKKKYLNP